MAKHGDSILPLRNHKMLADTFDALGHKRRVEIFKQLSLCDNKQAQFGHLCTLSGLTPATLSFHLKKMQKGGLIVRKQVGNATL
ncbi:MAG: helix-turn-helix domain-containing protein, partial [Robiginitomaculum sp.]|nr:helix-turn-helix domain-containing protein [Robiginitomaculum sp.]